MANIAYGTVKVKGKKELCELVYKSQLFAESSGNNIKTEKGISILTYSGEFKNGIDGYTDEKAWIENFDPDNPDLEKLSSMTLQNKSKLLKVEIEAWSLDFDEFTILHQWFKDGSVIVDELLNAYEVEEFNPESPNFTKLFNIGFGKTAKLPASGSEDIEKNPSTFIIMEGVLRRYKGKASTVIVPEGVTAIGVRAFYQKSKIKRIILPSSIKEIQSYAFFGCKNLEELIIPNDSVSIKEKAFGYGYGREEGLCEKFVNNNMLIVSGYFVMWLDDKSDILLIPEGVHTICEYAVTRNDDIKKIVLPKTIKRICENAIYMCSELRELNIPGGTVCEEGYYYQCRFLDGSYEITKNALTDYYNERIRTEEDTRNIYYAANHPECENYDVESFVECLIDEFFDWGIFRTCEYNKESIFIGLDKAKDIGKQLYDFSEKLMSKLKEYPIELIHKEFDYKIKEEFGEDAINYNSVDEKIVKKIIKTREYTKDYFHPEGYGYRNRDDLLNFVCDDLNKRVNQ